MIQYNLLAVAKRFLEYETLGELFRATQRQALQLTIAEQIWKIIVEIVSQLSEMLDLDIELLMGKLFSDNEQITKYMNFKTLSQAG